MSFQEISKVLGKYLGAFSLVLILPFFAAVFFELASSPSDHPQVHSSLAFLATLAISLTLSILFQRWGKDAKGSIGRKESVLIVPMIWFVTCILGALPFLFSGTLKSPLDACFESMSGFTTTGATVLYPKQFDPVSKQEIPITIQSSEQSYSFYGTVDPIRDQEGRILYEGVEAVGKALLFWRSLTQWLGGMGIVVLFIAVLPALSMGGRFLFEAEMPGPSKDSLTPRIRETAGLLWKIYVTLTVLQIFLLLSTNPSLSFFETLNLSLTTISTGGFSIKNDSLASYSSLSTQWIIMIFMVLGSLNFTLYFHCLKGKFYRIYEPEFFVYLLTLLSGCLWVGLNLWKNSSLSLGQALHLGSFQAISAQTSTGYAITNLALWPFSVQIFLILLLYVGGMSGSTSGGIKMARHYILFRTLGNKMESFFRPHTVRCLKIGEKEISENTAMMAFVFFCVLISCAFLGTYLLIFSGIDPETSFSVISSLMNNAGVFIGGASHLQTCALLPPFAKFVSILWMLLGRLEFFALLVLFVPAFWKAR